MNENTEAVEKDLEERLRGFNEELKTLLGKYELGIAALPKILNNGTISADPIIVSQRKKIAETAQVEEAPEIPEPITE